MISPLCATKVEKCKTGNRWMLALPFKNTALHSPIYQGLQRSRELGVALLTLLWKTWDTRNIVRPMRDRNLSRLESSVACIDYMCGRWVSWDEADMSRYVFTSALSSLEHKKVLRTNHAASTASNGRLIASAHAVSTMRQLSTIYLCNGLGVNCIWRTRLGAVIRWTGWSLRCNMRGAGWLDKSPSIRYAALVVTVKVNEWSGFALDDSRGPWRLRNIINLLTRQDQNGISWNWNSNICFFICVCVILTWI
jgi:hypothetical protein